MTISIWDAAMISVWIVAWFVAVGIIFIVVVSVIKKRKKRSIVLSAAALSLTEKLRKSVYTQEEFDEIVRMMKDKG